MKRAIGFLLALFLSTTFILDWVWAPPEDRGGPPEGVCAAWALARYSYPFQPLWIPPAFYGTSLDLTLNAKLIRAFQVRQSLTIFLIGPRGTILKVYPGYGRQPLVDLAQRTSTLSGISLAADSSREGPKNPYLGCAYDLPPAIFP
jgi:hypothetical protein